MAGFQKAAAVEPSEEITVTLVLRRPSEPPEIVIGGAPLTRDEFAARHGADADDVALVEEFARKNGLQVAGVKYEARSVFVRGTAEALQKAFGVELHRYEGTSGSYRGREGHVSVPSDLANVVVAVLGLDDRPQVRPHHLKAGEATNSAVAVLPEVATAFTTPEIASLYEFPTNVNGNGECIAILEFGGGYHQSDLTAYFQSLNITAPTVVSVGVDGGQNSPGNAQNPNDADGEVALDIEVAGAVAPGARLAVYFAPNTDQGFHDAITQAVHDGTNNPSVISISWGGPENLWSSQTQTAVDSALQDAAALGVTVFVAAGDHGSADQPPLAADGSRNPDYDGHAHADFPASSPHAVACGGTHLEGSGGSVALENVWNDQNGWATGGGISDTFALPTWQQNVGVPPSVNPGARVGRGLPDVAGDADPSTGYQVTLYGSTGVYGGTSAVAPLWAGLMALLNESAGRHLGLITPQLYQASERAAFRDVASGSNAIPAIPPQIPTPGYGATAGWDACTGLGSPIGAALRDLLAPPRSVVAFQANTGNLWTAGADNRDMGLGMMRGTSPSICAFPGADGREIAFQANTGDLWLVGARNAGDMKLGMMQGTSPSICSYPPLHPGKPELPAWQVAFQANTGNLWVIGNDHPGDMKLGMMAGTSPSVCILSYGPPDYERGWEVAFQANTGNLWVVGSDDRGDLKLGMMKGTSPSICALPAGGWEVAFQANTGNLWVVGSDNRGDMKLGMMAGTSPSICPMPGGGWEVAFQANTGNLWVVGSDNRGDMMLGMMAGTSPSICALPGGGWEVAFQANTGDLWVVGSDNRGDMKLGMMAGTSPGICRA